MIQAKINNKTNQHIIDTSGDLQDLLQDIAILVSGIYTQLKNSDPFAAAMFHTGLQGMVADNNGPMWRSLGNQTGIVFTKPED